MSSKVTSLRGRTIVLGVTGGIAAYKACDLVSRLRKAGADVFVIMTQGAQQFVRPLTFVTLSGNPVATDTFQNPQHWEVEHIALAKKADAFVIAPATADIIAKFAHGLADDMLSTTVLATAAPVLVAPAMNTQMYLAPVTQENIGALKARGWQFVGPGGGMLACGDVGPGRMEEPEAILEALADLLSRGQDFAGLKALVTAGPTREAIDPVRFISNRSSGRMGYAIAEALLARGAEVTLVSGPTALDAPQGAARVDVLSTEDLYQAVMARLDDTDLLIQAAAPADYTPVDPAGEKLSKRADEGLSLALRQTVDVARAAGEVKRPGQIFVGFAAETGGRQDSARRKLREKNLDLICFNDVTQPGAGFDVATNILTLITGEEEVSLPMMSKREAADRLLDQVLRLRRQEA